ncbi:MAG: M20/M25/M40 family metallo-hydrolase [Chloroflexia bacterium]|nr:M20/M25/M40 family metallo-hydrolase [Chloroflexia bacterium]
MLTSTLVAQVSAVAGQLIEPIADLTTVIASVPAPTNDEAARALVVGDSLTRLGHADVRIDELSDVIARLPGKDSSKALLLAAHIDTVFPIDTEINVTRSGDVLSAPGIGDNSLSVAAVAMVGTALEQLGWELPVDVYVTGNVGEEGLGDLRGMRAVIGQLPMVGGVIAVEGHSLGRITHKAVGSRRLRVSVTGPGGHSWGDAGRPSAIHALARLVSRLDEIELAKEPKTTLNVGLFQGGISVNTIAPDAAVVIDMRSTSGASLDRLVDRVEHEIALVETADLSVTTEVVGNRPAGEVSRTEGMVPIGIEVLRALGIDATCDASSTDANIPISLGIPAMCIGLTTGGNVHRVDEFVRLRPLATGFAQLILNTIVAADAIQRDALG